MRVLKVQKVIVHGPPVPAPRPWPPPAAAATPGVPRAPLLLCLARGRLSPLLQGPPVVPQCLHLARCLPPLPAHLLGLPADPLAPLVLPLTSLP